MTRKSRPAKQAAKPGGKMSINAGQNLDATKCPFCADPTLLASPPKRKGKADGVSIVRVPARMWRNTDKPASVELNSRRDGGRFIVDLPTEQFAEPFAGFSARLVGVGTHRLTEVPPVPFANVIMRADGGPGVVWSSDYPLSRHVSFVGVLIEGEGVNVAAHWWPSHGWRVELRTDLATGPAVERNADLQRALAVLEFFRLETRGADAPKIEDTAVFQAIKALGPKATQAKVAERLGVAERSVRTWLKNTGWPHGWGKLKRDYLSGDLL
jgi:hypothetical protein